MPLLGNFFYGDCEFVNHHGVKMAYFRSSLTEVQKGGWALETT